MEMVSRSMDFSWGIPRHAVFAILTSLQLSFDRVSKSCSTYSFATNAFELRQDGS